VIKFSLSASLHSCHVDTDSSGKVLSVATERDKFSATAISTNGSVQQDKLHGPQV